MRARCIAITMLPILAFAGMSTSAAAVAAALVPRTGGTTLWFAQDGHANTFDGAGSIAVAPDGSTLFVSGHSSTVEDPYNEGYRIAAYDAATGTRIWSHQYDGPTDDDDYPTAIGVSPDGSSVLVTGVSPGVTTGDDWVTLAYDAATGQQRWEARFNGAANGDDDALALVVSPAGSKVFVTGYTTGTTTGQDYATEAYDATTGARLWTQIHSGPGEFGEVAHAVGVTPDGTKVFITGNSRRKGGRQTMNTIAYDAASGHPIWAARSGALGETLAASPDGQLVYVSGSGGSNQDMKTFAYDVATGAEVWRAGFNWSGYSDDEAVAIAVSPDGSKLFLTGNSGGSRGSGFVVVGYDAHSGQWLWKRRFGFEHDNGTGEAIAVSPDGTRVFATGWMAYHRWFGSEPPKFITAAMDASTGARVWMSTHRDDTGAQAYALAVSPDGSKVFVTGNVQEDWVTIAYSA